MSILGTFAKNTALLVHVPRKIISIINNVFWSMNAGHCGSPYNLACVVAWVRTTHCCFRHSNSFIVDVLLQPWSYSNSLQHLLMCCHWSLCHLCGRKSCNFVANACPPANRLSDRTLRCDYISCESFELSLLIEIVEQECKRVASQKNKVLLELKITWNHNLPYITKLP